MVCNLIRYSILYSTYILKWCLIVFGESPLSLLLWSPGLCQKKKVCLSSALVWPHRWNLTCDPLISLTSLTITRSAQRHSFTLEITSLALVKDAARPGAVQLSGPHACPRPEQGTSICVKLFRRSRHLVRTPQSEFRFPAWPLRAAADGT